MNKLFPIFICFVSFFLFSQTLFSFFHAATTFTPDFSIFYQSAKDVLHNTDMYHDQTLYTFFNYPITTTFFYLPFTFLSYVTAQEVFVVINIFAAIFCVFVSFKILKWHVSFFIQFFVIAIFLFSFPTKFTIGMGQSNLIAYVCILCSYYFYQNKKIAASIALFILAIILKPIVLFLIIFYFFKKEWIYILWLCACLTSVFLGFPILLGKGNAIDIYIKEIIPRLNTTAGREVYYNQGLTGFTARLTTNIFFRKYITELLSLSILIIVFVKKYSSDTQLFSLLLTVLVLINPLSWQHHFVLLLLPFLFCIQKVLREKNFLSKLFLTGSYFLIVGNIKNPSLFTGLLGAFILSHAFWGTIGLFILLLQTPRNFLLKK